VNKSGTKTRACDEQYVATGQTTHVGIVFTH
jgi:hypothetical protein